MPAYLPRASCQCAPGEMCAPESSPYASCRQLGCLILAHRDGLRALHSVLSLSVGRVDCTYHAPDGKRFRSMVEAVAALGAGDVKLWVHPPESASSPASKLQGSGAARLSVPATGNDACAMFANPHLESGQMREQARITSF